MFATTSELKTTASTSLIVRIDKVSIALATSNLDEIALNLDLEGVLLEFQKLATTLVDTQRLTEIEWLTFTPLDIGNSLVTI
jgi:hypothetical protein